MSLSSASDLPVLGGQASLHPHPSCDGIRGYMNVCPFTHYHKQVGDTHLQSSRSPCTLGYAASGQPAHSTRAFSGYLGSWQHRQERGVISTQNVFPASSPPRKTQPEAWLFSRYGQHAGSTRACSEGLCEAVGKVLAAPTSPAVIVFPQAQLEGIRSVGMVRFQNDIGRVPEQARPAHEVGVGHASVRMTISLVASGRCIYGRM